MSGIDGSTALKMAATLGSAAATGLMLSFSIITVPLLQAPEPELSNFQRWRLWRKAFERGQATIPPAILPNIILLGFAWYRAPAGLEKNLLLGAGLAHCGVYALTPTIMLKAGLRADLLDSVKTAGDEEKARQMVARFQLFHSARIACGLVATALSAYSLLL